MITLRRAEERRHDRHRERDVWFTFHPRDRADPRADRFGQLESLRESRLPPGTVISEDAYHDAEIVTYVREGALAYEDAPGRSGVIQAGEFQGTTAGRGIRRSEKNASRSNWARVFQLLLAPSEPGLEPGHEQRRFSTAERRGGLCVVASADARRGSLRIHQDALMCSALLEPGQHAGPRALAGANGVAPSRGGRGDARRHRPDHGRRRRRHGRARGVTDGAVRDRDPASRPRGRAVEVSQEEGSRFVIVGPLRASTGTGSWRPTPDLWIARPGFNSCPRRPSSH